MSGTSIVSTLSRLSTPVPAKSLGTPTSDHPCHSSDVHLQARSTPSKTCPPSNQAVIVLSTTLVIPDYKSFWKPTPIASFRPTYSALNDGSLVTSPFIDDLFNANLSLLVIGALAMLFVRNIFVSGDYLRRGKVRKKTLFYFLFISQMLAPISLTPVILSYFNQRIDCTSVIVVSCVSGSLSLALLITGILGVKAYKCLNNPRFVFIVLFLFQCAFSTVVVIDVATIRGVRRLSGSCVRNSNLRYTRYFVSIQLLESVFIWLCFLYACWKTRGSASARGRISLQLSMEDLPIEIPPGPPQDDQPASRGWWDYVPKSENPRSSTSVTKTRQCPWPFRSKFNAQSSQTKRHPEIPSQKSAFQMLQEEPLARPPRQSTIRISESIGQRGHQDSDSGGGRNSPTPSSGSRLNRLIPRMELFRKVMQDELFYTTFITSTCVIVAVLVLIGVNFSNGLSVNGWIALNWGVISVLAIDSFGRVVRRHEREALLQHPSMIRENIRSHNSTARHQRAQRSTTVSNITQRWRPRRDDGSFANDSNNPFSDTRHLEHDRASWNSGTYNEHNLCGLSHPPSPEVNIREAPFVTVGDITPTSYFPTSGRETPLVPHETVEGATVIDGFSQSWILGRISTSESSIAHAPKTGSTAQ